MRFNIISSTDALNKVRESDVTHPESLTRMNGTWMHKRLFRKWITANYPLWRNMNTKPVSDFLTSSRTRCPPSVTPIKSTSPTWCVVQSLSSSRPIPTILRTMGSWCSSDSSDKSLSEVYFRNARTYLGHYDPKDPVSPRYRVFVLSPRKRFG